MALLDILLPDASIRVTAPGRDSAPIPVAEPHMLADSLSDEEEKNPTGTREPRRRRFRPD